MFSFLEFSPFGGFYSTADADRNKLIDDCRGSRTHINAAGIAKLLHTGNPNTGDTLCLALLCQRFGNRRVGIFCQTDVIDDAFFYGFSQLFCPYDDLIFVDFRQNPALGDSTIFFSVHTDTYYTHFFRKVNKIYDYFSTFSTVK